MENNEKIYVRSYAPNLGCDPEFFFSIKGKVVESGKVLKNNFEYTRGGSGASKVVRDGVQAELNPRPATCRETLSNEIAFGLRKLYDELLTKNNAEIFFGGMVKFTPEEMKKLDDQSTQFGCAPSRNAYTKKESTITVDPKVYPYRSAGGHIHIGHMDNDLYKRTMREKPLLMVKLLDVICGNTCVLVDRDPMQAERRKVYGRAGEYRLPIHGIEYRTLSNFWLRNYRTFGMAFGFARLAAEIAFDIYNGEEMQKQYSHGEHPFRILLTLADRRNVVNAINKNDFNLAKANWDRIKDYLASIIPSGNSTHFPITKESLPRFDFFVEKGLDYWFGNLSPMDYWRTHSTTGANGWESFLSYTVTRDEEYKERMHIPKEVQSQHGYIGNTSGFVTPNRGIGDQPVIFATRDNP